MKSLWQPPTTHRNLSSPVHLTPLKPPKNHIFLTHVRTSSSNHIPKKFALTATHNRIPPPANCCILFVGPNRAYVVEKHGEYFKTLRTGIHLLNPMVDKIAHVHSLKEQEIEIPLEKVTSADYEVVVSVKLYVKVVDPFLASYGNVDPISAVTELVETTMPLRSMAKKIILNPVLDDVKRVYDFRARINESKETVNFEILRVFLAFPDELYDSHDFKNDDHINKIAVQEWGVKCLRFKFYYYMPKEMMLTWEELKVVVDAFISNCFIFRDRFKVRKLYELVKQKMDKAMRIIEILRDYYYKSGGEGDSGAVVQGCNKEEQHGDF